MVLVLVKVMVVVAVVLLWLDLIWATGSMNRLKKLLQHLSLPW